MEKVTYEITEEGEKYLENKLKGESLSDKIWGAEAWGNLTEVVDVKDVRDVVKWLMEEHRNNDNFDRDFQEIIKKKFGDKLI